MFKDRTDAGVQLGRALEHYSNRNVLVLAIPRGGVEVGRQAARHINADFSILISRKLPFDDNPEAGFGAIAEDGSRYICPHAVRPAWPVVERIIAEQQAELDRRIKVLRQGRPLPDIEGRTVILIDDGIAAGLDTAKELARLVDEIVVLECPQVFYAVAQVYNDWYDVDDREAIDILNQWNQQAHKH